MTGLNISAISQIAEILEARKGDKLISHTDFAALVLANRRNPMQLSFDQIRELAAAILVLDHEREELARQLAAVTAANCQKTIEQSSTSPEAAEREPLIVRLDDRLIALAEARADYAEALHSPKEAGAHKKFWRAAMELSETYSKYKEKLS